MYVKLKFVTLIGMSHTISQTILLVSLAAIFGFFLGTISVKSEVTLNTSTPPSPTDQVIEEETDTPMIPKSLSIVPCKDSDINSCFGSGRSLLTKTKNTSVWNLVSTSDQLRFGILDSRSDALYEVNIE